MKDPSEVFNNEFEFLEWFTKDSFSRVVQEFNKEFDDLLRVVQQREDTAGSLLLRRDDQVLRSERKIDELQAENNELKQQLDDEIISSVRKEESFKESNQSNKNLIASLQSEVKALSAEVTEKEQQIQRLKKAVELKTKENNETITKLENVTQQFTQLQNTHNKMKQDSGTTSEKYRTLYWESDLKRINLEQEMLELKKKLNENQQQLVPQMQHANTGELEGKIVLLQSKLKSSERKKEHYKSLSRGTGKKLLEISNKLKESEEKRVKNLNDLLKKSSENMAYVSKIKELESKLMATQQKVSELEEVCQLSILSKESNEPSKKLQLYKLKKNLQNSEPSHDALLNLRVLEKEHELFMISYEEMKSQLAQLKEFNEFLQSKEKAQTDTNAEDIDFSFVSQTHKELVDRIKVLEGEINVLEERSATSENEAIHFKHLKENAEGALASLTQQYEEMRNQLLEQKQHKTEIERTLIEKDKENVLLNEQVAKLIENIADNKIHLQVLTDKYNDAVKENEEIKQILTTRENEKIQLEKEIVRLNILLEETRSQHQSIQSELLLEKNTQKEIRHLLQEKEKENNEQQEKIYRLTEAIEVNAQENQTLREQCAAQEQAIREIENTLGEKELGNLKLNEEIHTMINLMESAKKERISRKVDQKTSHSQTDEELEETYNAWREKLSTDIHKLKQQFFELSSLKQQEEQIYNNHVYKHKEKIKEILEEKKKLVNEIKDLKKMLKKMKSVKKGLEKSNTLNASEHKPVTQHETLPVSQKTSTNHLLQMSPITEHQSATPSMISELEKEPISDTNSVPEPRATTNNVQGMEVMPQEKESKCEVDSSQHHSANTLQSSDESHQPAENVPPESDNEKLVAFATPIDSTVQDGSESTTSEERPVFPESTIVSEATSSMKDNTVESHHHGLDESSLPMSEDLHEQNNDDSLEAAILPMQETVEDIIIDERAHIDKSMMTLNIGDDLALDAIHEENTSADTYDNLEDPVFYENAVVNEESSWKEDNANDANDHNIDLSLLPTLPDTPTVEEEETLEVILSSMKEIVDDTIIDDTHCEPLNTEEDGNIMIMTPDTIIESVHDLTELDVTNSSSANVSPYEGLSEPVLESYSEATAERVLSNDQSIESNQQSLETASNQQPFIDPQTIDFADIPVLNCDNSSNVEQQPPIIEASSEDIHDSSFEEMSVYQEEDDSSLTHPRSDNTIPCENTTNANVEDVVNSIENSPFDADNTAFTESSVIENREPKFVDLTQELGTNEEDIVEFRDKEHNENYGSVLDMLPTNENMEHREEESDDTSENSSKSSAKYLDSTVSKDQDLPNIEQDKESTNTNLHVLNDTMLPSSQLEEAVEPLEEFADENVLEVSETPYQHIMDERIDSVETCSSQEVSGQSEDQETSNTYQGTTNQEVSLDTMGQTTDTETEVTSSSENVGLKENSSSTLLIHEEVIQTETSIREDEDLRNSDDEENIIQSVINKEEINCSLPEIPSQTNETQEETTDLSHESSNTSENPLCTTVENHLSLSITKYQDLPNIYQEHTNESDNTSPQINAQLEEHSHENINTLDEILLEEPQEHDSPTQHSATPQNIDQATSALEAVNTWQDDSQEEMSLKHVPHMEDNALEIRSRPENAELIDTDSLEYMSHDETFHPTENIQEFADDENSSVFIDDSFANTLSVGYQSTNEGEIGDDESEVDSEYVFSPIQSSHRDTQDDEDDFLHAIQHLENMSNRIAKETILLTEDIEQQNDKNYETHKVEEGESIDTNVAVLENGQSFENSLDGGNTKEELVNELNRAITILNSAQENDMPTNTINNDSAQDDIPVDLLGEENKEQLQEVSLPNHQALLPCSQHDRFASTSELLQLEEDSVVVEPTTTYQNEEHREQIMDLSSLSLNNDSLNVSSSSTTIFNTPTKVVLQDSCVGTQISDMKEVGVETDEQYPLTPPNVVKFENRLHERIKEYEDDESDYFLNIPLPKTATRQVYYYERKYLYLKMRYRQMLEELVKFEIGCRHYKHNVAVLKGDLERAKKTLVSLNKDRHVKEQALLEKISLLSTKLKRTRQLLDKYVHGGGQVL